MANQNLITNQAGFSLAELMVAAGLLSLLAVATMKISDINLKSLKRSEASLETQSITTAISQNLLNGESCLNTLSPVGALTNGKVVPAIRNRVNHIIFDTTNIYGGNTLKIKSIKVKNVTISPSTIPSGQNGYGELNLAVELERVSSQVANSSKVVEKEIPLKVEVNSGRVVTRCYAATENAVDTAKIAACTSIGGVYNNSNDSCDLAEFPQTPDPNTAVSTQYLADSQATLEDIYVNVAGDTMTGQLNVNSTVKANQFCVGTRCRDFTAKNCSPGQMVEKINANGSLVCKGIKCAATKYFEGFDTNGNPICKALPTGSCATNQYIKQINPDGTVVCANVPYHWGLGCSAGQVIQSISSSGVPTCVNKGANMSCGSGQMMTGVYANGNPICSSIPTQVLNMSCPYGQQMVGISNNNPICRNRLECRTVVGAWGMTGSTASCNSDEVAVGGGFESESYIYSLGFAHISIPSGNSWIIDTLKPNLQDNYGRAFAVCCK